jgi:hypothetical protein
MRMPRSPAPWSNRSAALVLAGLVSLAAVSALVVPGWARSSPAAIAAAQWGLDGAWAIDCSKPPSNDNGYLSYEITASGKVLHRREFGGSGDVNDVQSVRILADGAIEITAHFKSFNQTRQWTNVRSRDGRMRTMTNIAPGTTDYSVRDGVLVHNGQPTKWQTRCGPKPSA